MSEFITPALHDYSIVTHFPPYTFIKPYTFIIRQVREDYMLESFSWWFCRKFWLVSKHVTLVTLLPELPLESSIIFRETRERLFKAFKIKWRPVGQRIVKEISVNKFRFGNSRQIKASAFFDGILKKRHKSMRWWSTMKCTCFESLRKSEWIFEKYRWETGSICDNELWRQFEKCGKMNPFIWQQQQRTQGKQIAYSLD